MLLDGVNCKKLGVELWLPGREIGLYMILFTNPTAKEFTNLIKDLSVRRKVLAFLDTIKDNAIILKNPEKSNTLGDGILELKPTDQVRFPYFYEKGFSLIITHGFVKKRNTAPPEEIEKAKRLREEYLRRKKGD